MAEQQMNPLQQNMIARQRLLQSGISMVKQLPTVNQSNLNQIRIPLQRMGIMTGVLLQFALQVDVTDAGTPAVSLMAPYNIAKQVTYTDFAGVNRTKTNGWQLHTAQSFKQGDALSAIPSMSGGSAAAPSLNYDTNILAMPTGTGNNQQIYFSIYVPMAYDPANDLTGAVLTQTNVGEHFITIDLPNALSGADPWQYPFGASSTVALDSLTVQAFQFYIQPQAMNAENLPLIDLSTVYGFEGGYQTTANIAANQDVFVNYPNNRSVLSALITYENNAGFTANGTDINSIVLLANSNTHFREMTPRMLRESMRNMVNSDIASGSYFITSRRQPILTQLYANVQAKFNIASVAGSGVTQLISQYEVQYASGSPLPGVTIAS
jgi:hypothetical protein